MLAFTFEDPEGRGRADPDLMQIHIGPTFDGSPADAAETALFHDILQSDTARRVLDWWLGLTRNGQPPMKSALTVRGMAPFISSLALIDCDLADDARVRIAGHDVEQLIGRPIAGRTVDALIQLSPGLRQVFRQTVYDRQCLRYLVRDLRSFGREYRVVGMLEMPVIDDHTGKPLVLIHFEALQLPLNGFSR